jgi:hypothetical protein
MVCREFLIIRIKNAAWQQFIKILCLLILVVKCVAVKSIVIAPRHSAS